MTRDTNVPARDLDELRIALCSPDGGHMTDEPEKETGKPKAQTEAKCRRQGAVQDGDGSRRAAHQDRLGQGAMHGCNKSCDLPIHQITTPPPNEKNDKKKLDAANAIDRPNTI